MFARNFSTVESKFVLPKAYKGWEKSIWSELGEVGNPTDTVDLTSGYPDFLPSSIATNALKEVALSDDYSYHQYSRPNGHLAFVNVIAKLYSKLTEREINPLTEVIVMSGEALLHNFIHAHVHPNDEVILIEPFYSSHQSLVSICGGICKYVPLKCHEKPTTSMDWYLDIDLLGKSFNKNTKLIIICDPHNPTGKMFTKEEVMGIADLCRKWNVLCLCENTYEFTIFENNRLHRISTEPGKIFVLGFYFSFIC